MKTRVKIIVSILLAILAIGDAYAILRITWQASVSLRIGELTPRSADISLRCSPSMIVYGETTTIGGQLHNATSEVEIPYQTLAIYYRPSFGASWIYITSVSTAFDGSFSYYWSGAASLAAGFYVVNATFAGNGGFDPWSSRTDLRVVIAPPPPTPVTPGSSSSPGEEIYTLRPTFTWTSVPGVDEYGLYIRDMDSYELIFDSQARGRTIIGTSYTLLPGVLRWGGHYRWNMNAHNEAGWGEYCSPIYFYVASEPPTDVTPPVIVEDFVVSDGEDERSTLYWTNPSDSDLAEVIVLRLVGEFPNNHEDGELVYRNPSSSPSAQVEFTDADLVNGRVYGYAVFSRDLAGNWNDEAREGENVDLAEPMDSTNQAPTASFTHSPSNPKVGQPIDFTSSSTDDGEIVLYEWDWNGDETYDWSTREPQVTFIYEEKGTFGVRLKVTDDNGATNTKVNQVVVSGWSFWEKVRGLDPDSGNIWQLTREEYQYLKSELYIFTFADLNQYENFHDYYDREDESTGSRLYWNTDWDLMEALNTEMDPEESPGLTYGIHLLNAIREMEKVESVWTQGYKMKASKYFSDLLDANSKWTSERATEDLADALIEVLKKMISSYTPALSVGVSMAQLVKDCLKFSIPLARLTNLLYYNSLWRYLDCRHDGMDHTVAWEELTLNPTQDYHIPTSDPEKLASIRDYFERLYNRYGSYLDDMDGFQRETKKNLRIFVLSVLKASHTVGHVIVAPHSPVEVRVYDSSGNITGIVNGELREEVLESACDIEGGMIFIYSTPSGCYYELVGTGEGIYGIDVANAEDGNLTMFAATDIPAFPGAVHQYTVDWFALSSGDDGVDVQVDSDGDSVFEYNFSSDSELSRIEYVAATTGHDLDVTGVTLAKSVIGEGYAFPVNVTIMNYGVYSETFNITVYANATLVTSQVVMLGNVSSMIITFTWNTNGLAKGNYTLSAVADQVPGEIYTADNALIGGVVLVTLPGDVDGDREVDIFDIVRIATRYQMTYPNPSWDPNADIIENGKIDIFDIVAACSHYGESW